MRGLLLQALLKGPAVVARPATSGEALEQLAKAVAERARGRLGRSLSIREIDAGSCNGCELEIHALNNPVYDIERFGLKFVASPRHADVLMVTGPVTWNMRVALERTYAAAPQPKWVIAVGDCARNCGVFAGSYACAGAVEDVVPVDLHVAGCPPPPIEILKGLLALMEFAEGSGPQPRSLQIERAER
jgi:Ni,Fe-hydrogenase III small subunit